MEQTKDFQVYFATVSAYIAMHLESVHLAGQILLSGTAIIYTSIRIYKEIKKPGNEKDNNG